jgi:hypothetical protein
MMNPLSGTWIANLAKSQRHQNHQFQSATLRFDVVENTISLTQSGVNMSGKPESSTLTLLADGREHPVPQAPGVVVVTQWVAAHVLETIGKKDGEVLGRGTYEVSPDNRTLTARVAGTDASGAAFEQVIVFDRE